MKKLNLILGLMIAAVVLCTVFVSCDRNESIVETIVREDGSVVQVVRKQVMVPKRAKSVVEGLSSKYDAVAAEYNDLKANVDTAVNELENELEATNEELAAYRERKAIEEKRNKEFDARLSKYSESSREIEKSKGKRLTLADFVLEKMNGEKSYHNVYLDLGFSYKHPVNMDGFNLKTFFDSDNKELEHPVYSLGLNVTFLPFSLINEKLSFGVKFSCTPVGLSFAKDLLYEKAFGGMYQFFYNEGIEESPLPMDGDYEYKNAFSLLGTVEYNVSPRFTFGVGAGAGIALDGGYGENADVNYGLTPHFVLNAEVNSRLLFNKDSYITTAVKFTAFPKLTDAAVEENKHHYAEAYIGYGWCL